MTNLKGRSVSGRVLAAAVGITIAAAPLTAAPAQADGADDAIIAALGAAGFSIANPAVVKQVSRSICPSLKDGAKSMAWLVTGATMGGVPRVMATRLVALTVKTRCPQMVKSVLT